MTTGFTFNNDQIKLHWKEDYVTEGLNKQQTAESRGVVRGFELAANGVPDFINIRLLVDAVTADGVVCIRNSDNRVVTLIIDSDITIDLSAIVPSGAEYWICAYADYTVGAPTTASIEILTTAELSAAPYVGNIVVLGWVNYTGANNLDPDSSTPTLGPTDINTVTFLPGVNVAAMREIARNVESKGRLPWQKALRFGRADEYLEAKSPQFTGPAFYPADWKLLNLINANLTAVKVDDTDPARGDLHFSINLQDDGGGVPLAGFYHHTITPVRPGDHVRISFRYKVPAGPIPNGWAIRFGYVALDLTGNVVTTWGSVIIGDVTGAAMPSYEEFHDLFRIPAGHSIAAIIPILTWSHLDGPGGAAWDLYVDELDIEVMPANSPDNESNLILPSDADRDLGATRSGPLQIGTFSGNAIPATAIFRKSWQLAMGDDDDLYFARIVPESTGGTTYPHIKMPGLGGLNYPTDVPVGSGNKRIKTLYQANIPRAYARIVWDGLNYTLQSGDSFGFVSGALPQPNGPGSMRLTFITDENGADWVGDNDYVVTFGTLEPYPFPGPFPVLHPVVTAKAGGAPRTMDVVLLGGTLAAALPADFFAPASELYVTVFKRGT